MINKIILILALTMLMLSCFPTPRYLPTNKDINLSPFGAYIELKTENGDVYKGELLSIDTNKIIIFRQTHSYYEVFDSIMVIPFDRYKKYKMRYAQNKSYFWTIPLFTIFPLTHGWLLLLTVPTNWLFTIPITVAGENAYTYKPNSMDVNNLSKFARYPQGIPENVELNSIKPATILKP
ncbi:hypothetical protein MASR1M45_13250 [Candidatus Kapaibacterium sp.]